MGKKKTKEIQSEQIKSEEINKDPKEINLFTNILPCFP